MRRITRYGVLAVGALLSGGLLWLGPAAAEILFRADFETGDFSQFSGFSRGVKPGHAAVVTDVVHAGKYAGRFTIHEDDVFNAQQLRVQVNGPRVTVKEGSDTFMSFYLYMADAPKDRDNFFYWEGSPPPRYQNVMTWWVEPRRTGPALQSDSAPATWAATASSGTGTSPSGNGTKWACTSTGRKMQPMGMLKLWWDGAVVLDRRAKTKGPQSVYFCQPGIHRSPHTKSVDTIYFDDFLCATTLEEIKLQKPPAKPDW